MRSLLVATVTLLMLSLFTAMAQAGGNTSANTGGNTSATNTQQQGQTTQQSMIGGSQTIVTNGTAVFPSPGANASSYPGLAGGYWSPLVMPSGNATKASSLLHLQDVIPAFAAKQLAKQEGGKVETHLVSFLVPVGENGAPRAPVIEPAAFQVIVQQPSNQTQLTTFNRMYQLVGINYLRGDDEASSFKILGTAIQDGLKIGADAMVYKEGASLEMVATSWGIGISNSLSVVGFTGGTGLGNVTAGGLGYTKARATYVEKPWMSVQYFKKRAGVTGFYSPSSTHPIVPAVGTLEMYPGPHVLQVSAPATPRPQQVQPESASIRPHNPTPVSTVDKSAIRDTSFSGTSLSMSTADYVDQPKGMTGSNNRSNLNAVAVHNIGWFH